MRFAGILGWKASCDIAWDGTLSLWAPECSGFFFREVPFGVVGLWKEICLASKGLVYETVSYFTVISVVFKEVVVISAYLLRIWFCMLLRASAMWVPCIQSGNHLCMCAKRRFSRCIVLWAWWGGLRSADDGDCGKGEQAGSSISLFYFAEICSDEVCLILYLQRILVVFSFLFKQLSVCGRLSSRSSKGIRANEEWQVDRCEVEGENKYLWSLIANGWGWLGGRMS